MGRRRGAEIWRSFSNFPARDLLILLLLSQWLSAVLVGAVEECPSGCTCENIVDEGNGVQGYLVNCAGLQKTVLPQGLPKNTTVLDLSMNRLTFVQNRTFAHLPNLTSINLDSNSIETLRPGAFEGIPLLRNLTLSKNMIEELPGGVFSGLVSLETLSLFRNDLDIVAAGVFTDLPNIVDIDLSSNRLIVLPDNLFNGLHRLRRLALNQNHLQRLGQKSFSNLTSLIYLNLARNDLTGVPEGVICGLPNITTFIISENPIRCTCEALWLFNWLRDRMLTTAVCVLPPDLKDTNLLSLEQSRFCDPPTVSIVQSGSILISGSFLSLSCVTTGQPQPMVTWSKSGRRISMDGERIMISGNTLQINRPTQEDSGQYFCSGTSEAGTAVTSRTVAVIDIAMELSIPNTTIMTGSSAQLACSSSISPLTNITVTWTFSPSSSPAMFVALPSSSRHLILSDSSLLISSAVLDDTGEYICNISDGINPTVQITRTLTVTAPPMIRVFPELQCINDSSIRLDSNQDHQLVCEADGNPVPLVQWVRLDSIEGGGIVLPMSTSEGQAFSGRAVLNFTMPSLSQSGVYQCLANSSIGSDSRTIRVVIRVLAGVNETLLGSQTLLAGSDLLLSCGSINPTEVMTLTWRREDGSPLPRDAVTVNNGSLYIPSLEVNDRAVYACHLDTGTAQTTLKYNITVAAAPVISSSPGRPPVVSVLIDDPITLFCNVTAFPPANITWFKDGQRVEQVLNSSDFQLVNDGRELVFSELEDEYSGVYVCEADNVLGNSSISMILDVQRRPFFRTTPGNLTIQETWTAVFRCSGGGNPLPTVQWWKIRTDGEAIRLSENPHVVISDQYLALVSVQSGSAGQYFCTISSPLGMRESPRVHLTVYTPPTFTERPPSSLVVNEGSPITLPCQATGDPKPAIAWFRGTTFLPEQGVHIQEPVGNLRLLSARPEDEGAYTCVAANSAGRQEARIRLTVIRSPNVTVTPASLTLNLGSTAFFSCLDHNSSPGNFTWLLPNSELTLNSSRVTVTSSGGLIVSRLVVEDSGNYTCVVNTAAGQQRVVTMLSVTDIITGSGAVPPSIVTLTPTIQTVPVGQTAQFVCQPVGITPTPSITWQRDGGRVPNLARISITQGLLTIGDVRPTDAGEYNCSTSTLSGNLSEVFQLMVAQSPFINRHPRPMSVMEVDPILLRCDATGIPTPDIFWQFDGNTLGPSDGAIIERTGDTSRLSIFNTTTANTGLYTCVARNIAGTNEHTVSVEIIPQTSPPFINSPPVGRRLLEGTSFRLDCLALGQPMPTVTWFHDGVRIVNSSRVQVDGRSVFVNASIVNDTGVYLCVANNSAGMTSHSLDIDIRRRIILPFFPVLPMSQTVFVGEEAYINCAADGTPPLEVNFFNRNLTRVQAVSNNFLQFPNDTIVVQNAQLSDTGDYLCEASNEVGHSRVWFTLTVRLDAVFPNFTNNLIGGVVVENSSRLYLDCQASGFPQPTITWRKDGLFITEPEGGGARRSVFPNGTLFVNPVREDDDGVFVCDATNIAGTIQLAVRVMVTDATSPAEGVSGATLRDSTYLSRASLAFPCPHRGHPLTFWMKNDRLLVNQVKTAVNLDGSLIIIEAEMRHEGKYTCSVATPQGVAMRSAKLKIVERKEPPFFKVHPPGTTHVLAGRPMQLHCTPGGPTPINRTWLFNGNVVKGERYVFLNGGNTLVVGRSNTDDAGTYTCKAANIYGVSEAMAEVKVHIHPINRTVSMLIGGSTQLTCAPYPNSPRVVWLKNGELVIPSFRMLAAARFLWLFGVGPGEEGDYSCVAPGGHVIETYYIDILIPPRILHSSSVVLPIRGSNANLDCTAAGSPRPTITWWFGDKLLSLSNKYSIFYNGTLSVQQTIPDDNGAYYCKATNFVGRGQGRSFLIVLDP